MVFYIWFSTFYKLNFHYVLARSLWYLTIEFYEVELLPNKQLSFYMHLNNFSDLSDNRDFKGSSDEENRLCNTVLITGPTGVGKTAAVYACAQELGFKVSNKDSGNKLI